ncbi:hypothetical protein LPTSP1_34260 [Leptospira johnsonii]|uniref:Uncharacterized protein n=1 Tax=Leptospira johnsonii TaxID=1917820 RepID=A0A2P2D742_9LEPT|nr:hypothetical protein LPTSP1_34260 [Leptospira johnsonii]
MGFNFSIKETGLEMEKENEFFAGITIYMQDGIYFEKELLKGIRS